MAKPNNRRVVAFGELLLRLTTRDHERFVQAREFDARYTGAEANAAVSLAQFGVEVFAVSKVPEHEIGQACINYLRQYGVNTDHVVRGGDRLGLVYFELGASQRATKLIYDRSHSCFQEARPEDFDWKKILRGKDWFHFSGTAPARGEPVARILKEALSAARTLGVTVSCDINYRSKLWPIETARRVMPGLLEQVDVAIVGVQDLTELFRVFIAEGSRRAELDAGRAPLEEALSRLKERFGLSHIAMTLREEPSASVNRLGGLLYDGKRLHESRHYEVQIVDRIGGGDAFAAGVIYGLVSRLGMKGTIEFAVAASCLKHTVPGDFNLASLEEIKNLIKEKEVGRVQR